MPQCYYKVVGETQCKQHVLLDNEKQDQQLMSEQSEDMDWHKHLTELSLSLCAILTVTLLIHIYKELKLEQTISFVNEIIVTSKHHIK